MKKCLLLVFIVIGVSWLTAQIQILPSDDMYADCVPNGASHDEGDLFLVYESAAEQEQIMMKWDLTGVQVLDIESSILKLHRFFSCGGGGGTTTAMIYLITEEWDEETWDEHTFIQYDDTSGFAYSFSGPSLAQDTWFEVDVSNFVNLWLYANQPNYGLVIIADNGQRHSKFNSKEAANPDFHPYLELTLATSAENPVENLNISLSNYPNPFNPITNIKFSLKADSEVSLNIYNTRGQRVKTLIEDDIQAGYHSVVWNGTDESGKNVSSGVYFSRFDTVDRNDNGKYTSIKKIILLK